MFRLTRFLCIINNLLCYRYRTTSHEIREDGGEGVSEGVEEEVQRLLVDYSKFMAEEEEGEGEEESSQPEPGVSGVGRSDEVVGFSEEEMQCIARLHLMLYGDEEVGVLQSTSGQPLTTEASYSIAGKIALSLDAIPGTTFFIQAVEKIILNPYIALLDMQRCYSPL